MSDEKLKAAIQKADVALLALGQAAGEAEVDAVDVGSRAIMMHFQTSVGDCRDRLHVIALQWANHKREIATHANASAGTSLAEILKASR